MHAVARQASEDIVPARLPLIQRQMVAQRVAQGVAVWLEEFDPRPAWRPLGVEVNVDDVRIDLLWVHPTRGNRADELKSGKLTARDHKQARSIDAAGMAAFGVSWQGVRLISLSPISSKSAIIRRGGAQ